ncbi:MAG TPA: orotidine-5'-phosphate decarboxylase [Thermoanaerobaculia bacterium]|nr:orotidine-5'-phosphate decarboxylase [Thermoanaerobaculia bacterium]
MTGIEAARDRICVALDFSSGAEARDFAAGVRGRCGWFKVGLELFVSEGPGFVSEIARSGRVFLDLKLHDIPNTVAAATRAAVRTGAALVNVHASGGLAMMEAARVAAAEEAARLGRERPAVIAVTVLTSLSREAFAELPFSGDPASAALALSRLAAEAGLDGVVCSAEEVAAIRAARGPEFLTVVPGIRPSGADAGDQKRVATPGVAVRAGASILVVGRPVTKAADPAVVLDRIAAEIAG